MSADEENMKLIWITKRLVALPLLVAGLVLFCVGGAMLLLVQAICD